MTLISRRRALKTLAAGTIGSAIGGPLFAQDKAQFRMRMGVISPPDLPLTKRAVEATERIRDETNGRLSIEVFPSAQLGADGEMLNQIRSGALDFHGMSALGLSAMIPVAALPAVGFAWKSYDALWPAMDGELGAHIRSKISASGIHVFDRIWDNGFRQLTTSSAIVKKPEDMAGLKLRVVPSPMMLSLFKSVGAAPVGLAWPEVYSALQTKVVDGQENPIPVLYFNKLYEVQKQVILTGHVWDGFWILAANRSMAKLPAPMRDVVAKHFNQSALDERKDIAEQSVSLAKELAAKGMTLTEVDRPAFREHLRAKGFYAEWRKNFGHDAWALLEKSAGKLS